MEHSDLATICRYNESTDKLEFIKKFKKYRSSHTSTYEVVFQEKASGKFYKCSYQSTRVDGVLFDEFRYGHSPNCEEVFPVASRWTIGESKEKSLILTFNSAPPAMASKPDIAEWLEQERQKKAQKRA